LSVALSDDPRLKPPKLLDSTQQAAIVAMVCGPPPPGHARWTIVLTVQEAQRRGMVGGTANVFCVVEPKPGRHQTHATTNRTAAQFAGALKRIAMSYPAATTIHLVLDNLNTHREKSLSTTFGAKPGHQLWRRFTVHYTPNHSSWLNPAELEASLWSRQCLGRQRIGSLDKLRRRTSAWNRWANRTKLKIDWRFSTGDARRVFHNQRIATHEWKH
jgi:hypothetical protein